MRDKMSFPLYGVLTIAEVVEALEGNVNVKVVSASLENDIVTLTYEPIVEPIVDEVEECFECGATCNYHEDWCPYNEP